MKGNFRFDVKHKCALCVNLKPSDFFYSSLNHIKSLTKFDVTKLLQMWPSICWRKYSVPKRKV